LNPAGYGRTASKTRRSLRSDVDRINTQATPFGMIGTVQEAEAFICEHRRKARRQSQRNDDQS